MDLLSVGTDRDCHLQDSVELCAELILAVTSLLRIYDEGRFKNERDINN